MKADYQGGQGFPTRELDEGIIDDDQMKSLASVVDGIQSDGSLRMVLGMSPLGRFMSTIDTLIMPTIRALQGIRHIGGASILECMPIDYGQ